MPLEGKTELVGLRRFERVVRMGGLPRWPGRIERRGRTSK